jgi:hypothetical protein
MFETDVRRQELRKRRHAKIERIFAMLRAPPRYS